MCNGQVTIQLHKSSVWPSIIYLAGWRTVKRCSRLSWSVLCLNLHSKTVLPRASPQQPVLRHWWFLVLSWNHGRVMKKNKERPQLAWWQKWLLKSTQVTGPLEATKASNPVDLPCSVLPYLGLSRRPSLTTTADVGPGGGWDTQHGPLS